MRISALTVACLIATCLASGSARAFPDSERERDQLPEARLHHKIDDSEADLPDSHQVVAGERKVALYVGNGVFRAGKQHLKRMFLKYGRSYQAVSAREIRAGILSSGEFSAIVMPGGKSWHFLADLGPEGAENIRRFIGEGGGYMGICAGAFYAVSHRQGPDPQGEPYGIGLLNGTAYDGTYFRKFPFHDGMVSFDTFIPGFRTNHWILMLGGPSFRYSEEEARSKQVQVLGEYSLRKGHPGAPGSQESAMISFHYGKGRVFLSGPHGEIEEGRYLLGLIFRDYDSEWPFLNAFLTWLSGGPYPGQDPSQRP